MLLYQPASTALWQFISEKNNPWFSSTAQKVHLLWKDCSCFIGTMHQDRILYFFNISYPCQNINFHIFGR